MTDDRPPNPALLPAGLGDPLPPDAEAEAAAVEAPMTVFAHGCQRAKLPLLAFEDSLLASSDCRGRRDGRTRHARGAAIEGDMRRLAVTDLNQ